MNNNLKVIESELVPVYMTDAGEKVVNGRELHKVLQSRQDFSTWVKARLKECDAVEKVDYDRFHEKMEANNATMIEYIIKLATAKEMAMLERNEKGKQVRRYFISIEEKYKENQLSMTTGGQIRLIAQGYMELEQKIDTVEQKVEHLEKDIPLYGSEADEICNHVKRKGVVAMGGKESNSYKDTKIRAAVYTDIYNQIKREFGLYDDKGRFTSYKALKRRYIYEAHELIDSYELPTYLAEQIKNSNAQLNVEVA